MSDNLKEREAFEAWFGESGKWAAAVERSGEGYKLAAAQSAWATWQARSAIEADRVSRDVPADARRVIELCQKALAEELSAWDIEPPLHHVKEAHDACSAWLAAPQTPADGMQPIDVLTSAWNAMQNSADGDDLLSKLEHMRGSIERSVSLAASPQPQPVQASEAEKLMDAAGLCRRCAAPKDSAVSVTSGGDVVLTSSDVAGRVCRAVAELPDRNSPDGWPEAMLVTESELHEIVLDVIAEWVDCSSTAQANPSTDSIVQAAVIRALDEANVRDEVLRGMCIEVALEKASDMLEGLK